MKTQRTRGVGRAPRRDRFAHHGGDFYENILASSFNGIMVADNAGNIVYANPAALRLFGYSLAEMPTIEEWCHRTARDPLQAQQVVVLWNQDRKYRNPSEREFPLRARNGAKLWCKFRMSAMGDGYSILNIQNITLRKNLEERYHAFFEQTDDAILLRDAETGELLDFNCKVYEMLGYTRDEYAKLATADIRVDKSPASASQLKNRILNFSWPCRKNLAPYPSGTAAKNTMAENRGITKHRNEAG